MGISIQDVNRWESTKGVNGFLKLTVSCVCVCVCIYVLVGTVLVGAHLFSWVQHVHGRYAGLRSGGLLPVSAGINSFLCSLQPC